MQVVKEYIDIVYFSSELMKFDDYEEYGHDYEVAVHRVFEPRSMVEFPKWFAGTSLPDRLGSILSHMDSKLFSSQMNNISKEQVKEFGYVFF